MRKFLAFFLVLAAMLTLVACGASETPAETTEAYTSIFQKKEDNFPYAKLNNHLTWDDIEAFPIKTEDMTVQEMRELCVEFMNFSKTVVYMPNDYLEFEKNNKGAMDQMIKGQAYGGVPYIGGGGCGNVYRLMDYIDEETGVLDME